VLPLKIERHERLVLALAAALVAAACSRTTVASLAREEGETMTTTIVRGSVPAIDAATHARVETATFALG
jgi:hypothetical protein